MAGKADIMAGSAFVRLFLKDDLTNSLSRTVKSIGSAIAPFAALATAGFGAAAASVTQFVNAGSAINDMSGRTGASAKQLQEWTFAASQTGASAEDLEKALRSAAKNGVGPGEFERVGMEIASIADPASRTAAALETFGKSGTKLIPMFADLNNLKASSAALGSLLTDEEVKNADALGDAFGALVEALKRASQQFAATLGPHLIGPLQTAIGMVTALSDAISGKGTDFSGDLLDRLAQFRRMGLDEFKNRGKAATNAFTTMNGVGGADPEEKRAAGMGKQADIMQTILRGERERASLVAEFATPQEKALKKLQEFNAALIQVNKNRVLGFISPQQAAAERAALEDARRRFIMQENQKGMKPSKPDAVAMTGPNIEFKTLTASSAFGALALQNGGGKQPALLAEAQKNRKVLERSIKILEAIERKSGPKAIAT